MTPIPLAKTLSDRPVVMRDGLVQRGGTPLGVYDRPANVLVARFLGSPSRNLLRCSPDGDGGRVVATDPDLCYPLDGPGRVAAAAASGREALLGARPDDVQVGAPDGGDGVA